MNTRQIVRAGLDILKPYMHSFAEQRLRESYGPAYAAKEPRMGQDAHPDVQALFGVYLKHWNAAFSEALKPADRGLIFELKDARNLWAHEQPVSLDQAYRALDSVELLLRALGVNGESDRVRELKHEIRVEQVEGSVSVARTSSGPADRVRHHGEAPPTLGQKGAELRGRTLRIAPRILKEGNPRQPNTHGWLAFEVLRRAEGGTLPFEEYGRRLFNPDAEIRALAKRIPGVPNAYQDIKHIRHDIRHGRVYVE